MSDMTHDTTARAEGLNQLARRYREQAAAAETGLTDEAMRKIEVDILIVTEVYEAAMLRATREGRAVAPVARAILFQAAAEADPDPVYSEGTIRPPLREYRSPNTRSRLRFKLPRVDYEAARAAIMKSGSSVSAAIEHGLAEYARTGKI